MNKEKYYRFTQEIGEILDVPDKLMLIDKLLNPSGYLTLEERKITIEAIYATIILSLCKAVEKRGVLKKKSVENLKQQNPDLGGKIEYIITARDVAIAHLDGIDKLQMANAFQQRMGETPKEIYKSFDDVLNWVLEVLDMKSVMRYFLEELYSFPSGHYDKDIENLSSREAFNDLRVMCKDMKKSL